MGQNTAEHSKNYQGVIQPVGFPPLPEGWVSDWETFPSSDGELQLYAVTHHPQGQDWKDHRALIILHGLGEHGGRYLHVPHYVQSFVGAVYCPDHRGHGRSEGLRGHVDSFEQYTNDVALNIRRLDEHLKRRFGKSEIHLVGHSMGGLIALMTCFKHQNLPIHSVAVSAPLLGIEIEVPFVKKSLAGALAKVWGTLHMTSDLDARLLSHDEAVVKAYQADRLVHSKVTPKFFIGLQNAMAEVRKQDSGFQYPLLCMIPLQDKIVASRVALDFFRDLKIRDKALKTYPEFFHEPLNELGKEQLFTDLTQWIGSHSISE